ncbi:hypothetical protein PoMZ_04760 [Pyricularia oryzae]|uniref:Uncharacterized protein n=1 Tax=Pyricularia oryzae TaxID=318829 RepID=A0A4P7NDC7_PYROR|nr:hypothetical protein PoMZ_04760 [Pyricularia oryzae]
MDSQPNAMKRKRDQSPRDEIEGSNAPKKLSTSDMRQPLGPDSGGTMNPVGGQAPSSPGTIPASPRQQLPENGKKKLRDNPGDFRKPCSPELRAAIHRDFAVR